MICPLRIGLDVAQTCQERAGCGWQTDSLARSLITVKPENECVLYHHFDAWCNDCTDGGTRLDSPHVQSPLRDLSAGEAAALWDCVWAGEIPLPGEPDIVQSNSYQALPVGSAKLVFFVHDVSFWVHPEFTTDDNRLHCQEGVLAALARADGFLFNSDFSRREFDRLLAGWLACSGKPWTVTPLGRREFPPADLSMDDGDFWLAVGTLEPRKNYATLVDALDLYWARSPRPLTLRIAGGDGWKSDGLREHLVRLEALGKAQCLGYVSDAELGRLYTRTQALVFPSWYEGFGLPVLEAMGHGAPVICSGTSSLPAVGGEAAIYVDPGSPESICTAMLGLEADPVRRAALSAAGRRQAARFTWKNTARQTLDFYRRVLASSPTRPA